MKLVCDINQALYCCPWDEKCVSKQREILTPGIHPCICFTPMERMERHQIRGNNTVCTALCTLCPVVAPILWQQYCLRYTVQCVSCVHCCSTNSLAATMVPGRSPLLSCALKICLPSQNYNRRNIIFQRQIDQRTTAEQYCFYLLHNFVPRTSDGHKNVFMLLRQLEFWKCCF